jgi:hypothetical protein
MFSSSFEVQPLVATPSPTVTNKQASPGAVSACTKKATNDSDTTPKIKHPKQQQEQQQEPLAASTSTPPPLNVQDYVQNFTELASSSIDRAYGMERSIHQSPRTGRLSTCLPEDVFSLLDIQYHSFLDFLQENGFATTTATTTTASNSAILTVEGQGLLMGTLVFLLRQIQETQERFRPLILNSSSNRSSSRNSTNSVGIEVCCAAANDSCSCRKRWKSFWSDCSNGTIS